MQFALVVIRTTASTRLCCCSRLFVSLDDALLIKAVAPTPPSCPLGFRAFQGYFASMGTASGDYRYCEGQGSQGEVVTICDSQSREGVVLAKVSDLFAVGPQQSCMVNALQGVLLAW